MSATVNDRYADYSFWLETAGEPLTPRPAMQRSEEVDVAIVGAGYTGLWTAYYLLRHDPRLKVAVVEREVAGYGASGRNGGWCSPRFPVSAGAMTKRWGADAARAVLLALQAAVDEIEKVSAMEEIDTCFRAAGTLTVARGAHQLPALRSAYTAYERLGLGGHYTFLKPEEVAERIRITDVHGGLYTPDGASIHPGRLVRGLARAVEARGGTIYEQTAVTGMRGGSQPRLITQAGELRARKAIVLAGEAYLTRLPAFHRALLPVYSLICLTEPLTASQWSQIGWAQGENLASTRNTVVYLTKTPDGRILFGSRGAPYAFGSQITDAQDRHAATLALIQRSLLEWFPSLDGIRFTHGWGGPVGMPMDWTPAVRFDRETRIAFAGGYTGQGVSTANLAGQMLAGMIAERTTGFESLPFAQRRSPAWIPEPLRWMVVRYMQGAFLRIDEAAEAGRRAPVDAPLAQWLGHH
jgi:glycine/D-amino acid oxidase-like deaminating enzyme